MLVEVASYPTAPRKSTIVNADATVERWMPFGHPRPAAIHRRKIRSAAKSSAVPALLFCARDSPTVLRRYCLLLDPFPALSSLASSFTAQPLKLYCAKDRLGVRILSLASQNAPASEGAASSVGSPPKPPEKTTGKAPFVARPPSLIGSIASL